MRRYAPVSARIDILRAVGGRRDLLAGREGAAALGRLLEEWNSRTIERLLRYPTRRARSVFRHRLIVRLRRLDGTPGGRLGTGFVLAIRTGFEEYRVCAVNKAGEGCAE